MQNTLWARCTKRVFYFFTAGRRRQCSLTLMRIAYEACGMASTRQTGSVVAQTTQPRSQQAMAA